MKGDTPFDTGQPFWSTDVKTVYDPSPIGYRVIDRYYVSTGSQVHFYNTYARDYRYLKIYGNIGYPGAYLGDNGNFYLPAMGYRGRDSLLESAPLSRTEHAGNPTSYFWSAQAEGKRLNCTLYGAQVGAIGSMGTGWDEQASRYEAYPVICILE